MMIIDKFYPLNDKLTQSDFYRIINNLKKHKIKFEIGIDLNEDHLDWYDEELYDEFDEINSDNINEIVGFVVLKNIIIDKITILKNNIKLKNNYELIIYSNYIYSLNSYEKIIDIFSYSDFDPDYWIGEKNER